MGSLASAALEIAVLGRVAAVGCTASGVRGTFCSIRGRNRRSIGAGTEARKSPVVRHDGQFQLILSKHCLAPLVGPKYPRVDLVTLVKNHSLVKQVEVL